MSSPFKEAESVDSQLHVAVLIACHNRKNKTIQCLESLYAAKPSNWYLKIYLVDDGCTDGTREAVEQFDPAIQIIQGNGSWYWAHSMYQAEMAINEPYDALLWLNDDTELNIDSLTKIHSQFVDNSDSILVGQFKARVNDNLTYGGYVKYDRHPFHFKHVYAKDTLISVDTFNGNLVFIPKMVSSKIGTIDGGFAHAYADIDFGLRAQAIGIKMKVVPGFIGVCDANPKIEFKNLFEEFNWLISTKSTPIRSQFKFLKRHGGIFWWVFIFTPFIRLFLINPIKSNKLKLKG